MHVRNAARSRAWSRRARDLHGLRPAPPRRRGPHRARRWRSGARCSRGFRWATRPGRCPAAYDDGEMLLDATLQQGLEGVVSKRRGSRYRFDAAQRGLAQVRPPPPRLVRRRRLAPAGRARPTGWRRCSSASMTPDGLLYRGRVGSGIAGATSSPAARPDGTAGGRGVSPFADEVPRVDAAGTFWVEPRGRGRRRHPRPGLRAAAPAVVPGRPRRPLARGPADPPDVLLLRSAPPTTPRGPRDEETAAVDGGGDARGHWPARADRRRSRGPAGRRRPPRRRTRRAPRRHHAGRHRRPHPRRAAPGSRCGG